MKLTELSNHKKTSQVKKIFEGFFEQKLNVDVLPPAQAKQLLQKVKSLLETYKSSANFYQSEKNPSYIKLLMIEQSLTDRMTDFDKNKTMSRIDESEVQQAQVVLAAQDMVDQVQGMLEDVSELQFKDLPALVDSIKNQIGLDQSSQFNQDASQALSSLVQNLQLAKQQLETALGVVTGQVGAVDTLPAPGLPTDQELPPVDLDQTEIDIDADELDKPVDGPNLGRERR
jgi:hypothetical protein